MQIKPYINRRKEIIKQKSIKQEITKKFKSEKGCFFEKINKIDKSARQTNDFKKRKIINQQYQKRKGDISKDTKRNKIQVAYTC